MFAALVNDRLMAKHPGGRPRKNLEMTGIRIEKEVNDLAREAGAIFGESIVAYVTRIVRERAKADILENAKRRIRELEDGGSASKGKTGES